MKLNKFMPLSKMEEQTDGSLFVYGLVTAQQPDLDKEVCDYETTKAEYESVRDENLSKTSVPGMTPSVMPMREMHQLITQGAGRSMVFDDANKSIHMGFQVVDENAVKKWKAGCFVGFSQGGAYLKRWPDPDFPGCTRYTARPSEVSAVDAPCLPIALVETMKGAHAMLVKADGAKEEVALQVPEEKPLESAPLPVATLDIPEPVVTESADSERLDRIERALEQLLGKQAQPEPPQVLPAPPEEKPTQKAAPSGEEKHMSDTAADLKKKAAIEKMKDARKAHYQTADCLSGYCDHDDVQKCLDAAAAGHEKIKAAFEDTDKPAKGEKVTPAPENPVIKSLEEKLAAMEKSFGELTDKLSKTPATPPAHTGVPNENRTSVPGFDDLFKGVQVAK